MRLMKKIGIFEVNASVVKYGGLNEIALIALIFVSAFIAFNTVVFIT